MTLKYFFSVLLIIATFLNVNSQSVNEDVLFTVSNEPVYTSEFIRVYNKNLNLVQDNSQKNIDEYLKLFTQYKLKIKEAKALGFDKKESYKKELSSYREQLIKSFIVDTKVTEDLVKEAYERVSYELEASHILIRVDENASESDTLKAYNDIVKLRGRALKEDFKTVQKEVHNGETIYGEDLGYFSGFRMVYKFESVAFNTKVGDISQPFRTRYGYHIVNVTNKRKSRGEVTVAHIMLTEKENDSLAENPKVKIQEIYKKISQGESFGALAKQFSDDVNSASKGGVMSPISSGQIGSQKFEDIVFNLKNKDEVSEPFKTKYGWHIVKLINKKLTPPFEDIQLELEQKVKNDDRSKLIDEALYSSLRKKYNVSKELQQPDLNYFLSIFNDDYLKKEWGLPANFNGDKLLFKIENKEVLYKDFGKHLENTQFHMSSKISLESILQEKFEVFLNNNLLQYRKDTLEKENEEFALILEEYRDGLLLFDLMETTIWNTSKADSLEIEEFYNTNKAKYFLPERINAVVASSTKQKTLKKVSKLLKKGMSLNEIKPLINSDDKIQVLFTVDTMSVGHQAIPKSFEFKKGVSKIYKHNEAFVIGQVKDVLPKSQKTFEESKGAVISDYQKYKEGAWLESLETKYKVVLNPAVLEQVKLKIKNQ